MNPSGTGSMSYSIKIINPAKKAEYMVQKLHGVKMSFKKVDEIKGIIEEHCDDNVSVPIDSLGYVEPGHGAKGKQRWLITDADIADMYKAHQGKKEILLWCYSRSQGGAKKRPLSPDSEGSSKPPKLSRYTNHVEKMTEVQEIEEKIKELHNKGGTKVFSDEQIRTWAHLIQMGKHSSYDFPPDKPFWRNHRNVSTGESSTTSATPDRSKAPVVTISPGKRVNLRGQCVEQLLRLHQLMEKGGISKAEYDEMQESIMAEVKKF